MPHPGYEWFETLLENLLKKDTDKSALTASKQLVTSLVDNVLTLDEHSQQATDEATKEQRLLSCLTTLYLFRCGLAWWLGEWRSRWSVCRFWSRLWPSSYSILRQRSCFRSSLGTMAPCVMFFSKVKPTLLVQHAEVLQPYLSMKCEVRA